MLILWVICGSITILALALVLYPLLRSTEKTYQTAESLQITLYKERRAVLEQELNSGDLDAVEFKRAVAELDHALLEELPKSPGKPQNFERSSGLIIFLTFLLPISIWLLYKHWGHSQALASYYAQQNQSKIIQAEIKQLGTLDHVIAVLKQHLQQDPNSAHGWYLLGRLYLEQHQLALSTEALAKANQLKPNDAQIILSYAQSLYIANQGVLPKNGHLLLQKLLRQSPADINALGLLALSNYHEKKYAAAIAEWQKIATILPPDSEDGKMLAALIAKAQSQQDPNSKPIALSVRIRLARDFIPQVASQETVFVYVTAGKQSQIPLAVERRQVQDLPFTLTLNQADAMMPNATLATAKQVVVYARISKSGQPMPQAGDLIGSSQLIDVQQNKKIILVTINHRL